MRYVRHRPARYRRPESAASALPVRRFADGREVCLGNAAGRAEYDRRKQLAWEEQRGECDHCRLRVPLGRDCRLTGGSWIPSGQLRDDRLRNDKGERVNALVHKQCLRKWHEARQGEPKQGEPSGQGEQDRRDRTTAAGGASPSPLVPPCTGQ